LNKIISSLNACKGRAVLTVCLTPFILTASGRLQAQTLEDRITALMNQMTTAEKILQLHQEGGMNTADNQRLGIPGFLMADGLPGIREGMATSFPVGIGMASMWDTSMARQIGFAMGQEFRGKGKHQALGPALDIDRDPRNGRSPETGGEDPYLCAQITTAVVRGMQSTPIIATIKHYSANHRENGRTSNDIFATDRILNEDAGLAFRTAVQMGGALSVMNAYNLINGEKCAENTNLLTTILRTRWGFPYYVVSDWGSIWTSQKAITADCDVCMGSANYQNDLPGLVSSGAVSMQVLDQAVRRVLRTKFIAGMMDFQPQGDPNDVNSAQHQAICREAGRKSPRSKGPGTKAGMQSMER
jgi:beta-glucosidase